MDDAERRELLALGLALGNRALAARLLAATPPEAFAGRAGRRAYDALLSGDREGVRKSLEALGVSFRDGEGPADALLACLAEDGQRRQQRAAAARIADAAKVMPAERWREYVAAQVAGCAAEAARREQVAGRLAAGQ